MAKEPRDLGILSVFNKQKLIEEYHAYKACNVHMILLIILKQHGCIR